MEEPGGKNGVDLSKVLLSLEADHADALDSFVSNRLFEAGVWWSPGTSDGIQRIRVVECKPERLRICGRIWVLDVIDNTKHTFWLNLQRHGSESTVTWELYFDIVGGSDRYKRNVIDACDHAEDVDWRVVLNGEAQVRDDMLFVGGAGD